MVNLTANPLRAPRSSVVSCRHRAGARVAPCRFCSFSPPMAGYTLTCDAGQERLSDAGLFSNRDFRFGPPLRRRRRGHPPLFIKRIGTRKRTPAGLKHSDSTFSALRRFCQLAGLVPGRAPYERSSVSASDDHRRPILGACGTITGWCAEPKGADPPFVAETALLLATPRRDLRAGLEFRQ